ncbi:MAG: hypothetical protein C4567_04115 [Deltaproteobacteria bacterium]|nr:MAG: hypothetical protein C4567_04115 [Deltaproteobacteria bacterium]
MGGNHQDEAAWLRAGCKKLAEEKSVPWEEIARFFARENLDTVPGSALTALKQFLLSRSQRLSKIIPVDEAGLFP